MGSCRGPIPSPRRAPRASSAGSGAYPTRSATDPRGRRRRAWLVDEHPVPELEHEEAPQLLVVIGATGGMVLNVAADDVRPEVATLTSARIEEHVAGQGAKVLAKPVVDGGAESHL